MALAAALMLPGCVEQETTLIVNPDGSGKVVIVSSAEAGGLMGGLLGGGKSAGGDESAMMGRGMATSTIREAKGVEAWTDYRTEKAANGKTKVMLRGYFPDINKLKVQTGNNKKAGAATSQDNEPTVKMTTAGGVQIFKFAGVGGRDLAKMSESDETKERPTTEEAIKEKMAEERAQGQVGVAMVRGMLGSFKIKMTIQPSGKIQDAGGFTEAPGNLATFETGGKQICDAMELMLNDDALLRLQVTGGTPSPAQEKQIMKAMAGTDKPLEIKAAVSKPQFDYKAELAKAKAAQSPELKALLEEAAKPKEKSGALDDLLNPGKKAATKPSAAPGASKPAPASPN